MKITTTTIEVIVRLILSILSIIGVIWESRLWSDQGTRGSGHGISGQAEENYVRTWSSDVYFTEVGDDSWNFSNERSDKYPLWFSQRPEASFDGTLTKITPRSVNPFFENE